MSTLLPIAVEPYEATGYYRCQEFNSLAYIRAITSQIGLVLSFTEADEGIDVSIGSSIAVANGPSGRPRKDFFLQFQLKSTFDYEVDENNDLIKYDLKVKNFNDLCGTREPGEPPRFLAVHLMKSNRRAWVGHRPSLLALNQAVYFHSLEDQDPVENMTTKRVYIPRSNCLTPTALHALYSQRAAIL